MTHAHAPRALAALQAVFLNREELPIKALYRDPTHDFGFFTYDPAALQFLGPVRHAT
jgi:hypothetical protein